jgi:hypothetical protein
MVEENLSSEESPKKKPNDNSFHLLECLLTAKRLRQANSNKYTAYVKEKPVTTVAN